MTNETVETGGISDESTRRYAIDLMHNWRSPDTWLSDKEYSIKKVAAEALSSKNPKYLYPFISYLGISGADFEEAWRMVDRYERTGWKKRLYLSLYRAWRSLTIPFRLLRGYRY